MITCLSKQWQQLGIRGYKSTKWTLFLILHDAVYVSETTHLTFKYYCLQKFVTKDSMMFHLKINGWARKSPSIRNANTWTSLYNAYITRITHHLSLLITDIFA